MEWALLGAIVLFLVAKKARAADSPADEGAPRRRSAPSKETKDASRNALTALQDALNAPALEGAEAGASAGATFGPLGAAIGAVIGAFGQNLVRFIENETAGDVIRDYIKDQLRAQGLTTSKDNIFLAQHAIAFQLFAGRVGIDRTGRMWMLHDTRQNDPKFCGLGTTLPHGPASSWVEQHCNGAMKAWVRSHIGGRVLLGTAAPASNGWYRYDLKRTSDGKPQLTVVEVLGLVHVGGRDLYPTTLANDAVAWGRHWRWVEARVSAL